jgi:hypothetical protein
MQLSLDKSYFYALKKASAFFLSLWAREPVKICSEAKYFHNKPPAMRVRDKSL